MIIEIWTLNSKNLHLNECILHANYELHRMGVWNWPRKSKFPEWSNSKMYRNCGYLSRTDHNFVPIFPYTHTHTHISSWRMREHSKQNGFFFIYCSVWILPFEDRHVLPLQYIHFVVVNKEEHDAQNTLIACWWIHMNRLSKAISNALALYVVCFSSSDSNKTFCLLSCILDI